MIFSYLIVDKISTVAEVAVGPMTPYLTEERGYRTPINADEELCSRLGFGKRIFEATIENLLCSTVQHAEWRDLPKTYHIV